MTEFSSTAPEQSANLWRRIVAPVVTRLKGIMACGLTPQKLALTLCIGTAIGVLPLLWGTTLICMLLAHIFKLNHVALQSVNYLLYPLQLVLLVPFFGLGTRLFPWGPPLPASMIATLVSGSGLSQLHLLGWLTLKALAAWSVTVLPLALLIYLILKRVIKSRIQT